MTRFVFAFAMSIKIKMTYSWRIQHAKTSSKIKVTFHYDRFGETGEWRPFCILWRPIRMRVAIQPIRRLVPSANHSQEQNTDCALTVYAPILTWQKERLFIYGCKNVNFSEFSFMTARM